jgi:hypothetical protein
VKEVAEVDKEVAKVKGELEQEMAGEEGREGGRAEAGWGGGSEQGWGGGEAGEDGSLSTLPYSTLPHSLVQKLWKHTWQLNVQTKQQLDWFVTFTTRKSCFTTDYVENGCLFHLVSQKGWKSWRTAVFTRLGLMQFNFGDWNLVFVLLS